MVRLLSDWIRKDLLNSDVIQQIIMQYNILRNYCDSLWVDVSKKFPAHLKCHKGCSECCILQSVNILEAFILIQNTLKIAYDRIVSPSADRCAFLSAAGECTIYSYRPLLCRTHGLLLKSEEFIDGVAHSCACNFTSDDFDSVHSAIDIDSITLNAEKLSCAFAIAAGDLQLSSIRVSLLDIKTKNVSNDLNFLYQQ